MNYYIIPDKYATTKNVNGKIYGINLFTSKILYNPYNNYISKNLSNYTKKRIIQDVERAIVFYNKINSSK